MTKIPHRPLSSSLGSTSDLTEQATAVFCYRFFANFGAEFETAAVEDIVEAQGVGGDFYFHAARAEQQHRLQCSRVHLTAPNDGYRDHARHQYCFHVMHGMG